MDLAAMPHTLSLIKQSPHRELDAESYPRVFFNSVLLVAALLSLTTTLDGLQKAMGESSTLLWLITPVVE